MDRRLMPCARRDERGFTLIEIILVLLLMALMAGLVVQWSPKLKAPDAAAEHEKLLMIARIAHARNQAVIKNDTTKLLIISDGKAVQYEDVTPLTGDSDNTENNLIVQLKDVVLSTPDCTDNCSTLSFKGLDGDFAYTGPSKIVITPTSGTPATLNISGAGYVD